MIIIRNYEVAPVPVTDQNLNHHSHHQQQQQQLPAPTQQQQRRIIIPHQQIQIDNM